MGFTSEKKIGLYFGKDVIYFHDIISFHVVNSDFNLFINIDEDTKIQGNETRK